jgi:hypothetical protein
MPAARRGALGRGPQDLRDLSFIVPAPAADAPEADELARQCAIHEDRLAADVRHPASVGVQRFDLGSLDRAHGRHARFQAASYSRQCGSLRSASQDRARSTSAPWSATRSRPRTSWNRSHTR